MAPRPPTSSSPDPLKTLAGYGISSFLVLTGLVALLTPTTMAAAFGLPITNTPLSSLTSSSPTSALFTPAATATAAAFVQCFGARNLTMGILNTIFIQRGDLRAASTLAGLLAIDGLLDAFVTGRGAGLAWALPHVLGAGVIVPVARWMGA